MTRRTEMSGCQGPLQGGEWSLKSPLLWVAFLLATFALLCSHSAFGLDLSLKKDCDFYRRAALLEGHDDRNTRKRLILKAIHDCDAVIQTAESGDSKKELADLLYERGVYYKTLGKDEYEALYKPYYDKTWDRLNPPMPDFDDVRRLFHRALDDYALVIKLGGSSGSPDFIYKSRAEMLELLRTTTQSRQEKLDDLQSARADVVKGYELEDSEYNWNPKHYRDHSDHTMSTAVAEYNESRKKTRRLTLDRIDKEIDCLRHPNAQDMPWGCVLPRR